MCTPIPLGNIVGITENILLVGIVPLHGDLNADIVLVGVEMKDLLVEWCLVAIQVLDKRSNTALVFKNILFVTAFIRQSDAHSRIQEDNTWYE